MSLTIVANRINELPYVPHLHRQHQRFTPIHRSQKTIVTDPDLPGVALHLDPGNDVVGWDGHRADKVSIRTVPADRLPVRPLPPGTGRPRSTCSTSASAGAVSPGRRCRSRRRTSSD